MDRKKLGTFGSVEVRILELRDVKAAFCTVKCEITQRQTAMKKKNELNAKYDQDLSLFASFFSFFVSLSSGLSVP